MSRGRKYDDDDDVEELHPTTPRVKMGLAATRLAFAAVLPLGILVWMALKYVPYGTKHLTVPLYCTRLPALTRPPMRSLIGCCGCRQTATLPPAISCCSTG